MANWYNRGKKLQATAGFNWGTTQVNCLLVKSTYTFDPTKNFVSDIAASELAATNYVRKVNAYPGSPVTQDDTNNKARLFANALTWTALGGALNDTIGGVVYYKFNAADGSAELIFFVPTNNLGTAGNDVTFTPDATNGVATIS